MKRKKCPNCKKEFLTKYHKRIYCEECKPSLVDRKKMSRDGKMILCKVCHTNKTLSPLKYCDDCRKTQFIKQDEKHRLSMKKSQKDIYKKNKDNPLWAIKNRLRMRVAIKKKYNNDKNFRITMRIRSLVTIALKNYSSSGKIMSCKKYGIDIAAIIKHLKPFPEDLSKYHIDHIKPLCSFDMNDPEEVKKAFAAKNHRWLTKEENLKKIKKDRMMSINKITVQGVQ